MRPGGERPHRGVVQAAVDSQNVGAVDTAFLREVVLGVPDVIVGSRVGEWLADRRPRHLPPHARPGSVGAVRPAPDLPKRADLNIDYQVEEILIPGEPLKRVYKVSLGQ